jgi:hypothetical protein
LRHRWIGHAANVLVPERDLWLPRLCLPLPGMANAWILATPRRRFIGIAVVGPMGADVVLNLRGSKPVAPAEPDVGDSAGLHPLTHPGR